jgi:hypothetical protein
LRTYVMRLQNFKERDVMIFGVRWRTVCL